MLARLSRHPAFRPTQFTDTAFKMTNTKPMSITRAELHALVWSEPRSRLAGIWGISDVAIGKLCVKENIPAPPMGYWAKKAAGGKVSKTPLPMRLPGQRDLVELRALTHYERYNASVDVDSEIAPPTYLETVEEVVQAAVDRLGTFRAKKDITEPHRSLRRVIQSEDNRAKKSQEPRWSFDKPHFSEPRFQRQLRIFNSIFFILDAINATCDIRENDTFIYGLGHLHHLDANVAIGSSRVRLQFLEPENPKGNSDLPRSSVTTLRIGTGRNGSDVMDDPGAKIERCLNDVVKVILVGAEMQMRSDDLAIYERKIERQIQMQDELAERKRRDEAVRIAAMKAKQEAIRKEIADTATNLRMARDIRSLVETMAAHPDWAGEGRSNYLKWSAVALAEADSIDPMLLPVGQCFSAWKSEGEE